VAGLRNAALNGLKPVLRHPAGSLYKHRRDAGGTPSPRPRACRQGNSRASWCVPPDGAFV